MLQNLPYPLLLAAAAVRAVVVVLALVAGIRLIGKRTVGGLNLIDLLMVLLIGNAVQNALTRSSGNLGVGLVSAGMLLLIDKVLGSYFYRHPKVEDKVFGAPAVLGTDGELDYASMRREGVRREDVEEAMREQGVSKLSEVKLVVLEDNGSISIIPK